MHPSPIFRQTSEQDNLSFVRQRSFGVLTINGESAPLISHVPFVLSDDGSFAELHLVRSNPILQFLKKNTPNANGQKAVLVISGGDAYISPDWYGLDNQVPTWNYIAVHLRGHLKLLEADQLHGILERISAQFEQRLQPKKPWLIDKMNNENYVRMQRQIVPLRFDIESIEGTWKLNQNKSESAIKGVVSSLRDLEDSNGLGTEINSIADFMEAIKSDE